MLFFVFSFLHNCSGIDEDTVDDVARYSPTTGSETSLSTSLGSPRGAFR